MKPLEVLRLDAVERTLRTFHHAPRNILEVGCGEGVLGAHLAARGRYLGMEPDTGSFALAAQRFEQLGLREVRNEPFSAVEGQFDLVCAFEVLEHMEDDGAILKDWLRRLGPGGMLLLSVPGYLRRFTEADEYFGHFRRYEPAQLRSLLLSCGLQRPFVAHYGFPLSYLMEFVNRQVVRRRHARQIATTTMGERTASSGRMDSFPDAIVLGASLAAVPFKWAQGLTTELGPFLMAGGFCP